MQVRLGILVIVVMLMGSTLLGGTPAVLASSDGHTLYLPAVAVPQAGADEGVGQVTAQEYAPIIVEGLDDIDLDRQNIQAALEAALPGDTIRLSGRFQLDGIPLYIAQSRTTLEGVALDNDGDGQINEDWADGQDNDGDGSADEDGWDAELVGLLSADGAPQADFLAAYHFNHALVVMGGQGSLRDIHIRHLAFTGFIRTILLTPALQASAGYLCSGYRQTEEHAQGLTIADNLFDNTGRAVSAFGPLEHFTIQGNKIIRTTSNTYDIVLGQLLFSCFQADGSQLHVPFERPPQKGQVVHNLFTGPSFGAIHPIQAQQLLIAHNELRDKTTFGVSMIGGVDNTVQHNLMDNMLVGVSGSYAGPNNQFRNNAISNTVVGVLLDLGATGYAAVNNQFHNSALADHLLFEEGVVDNRLVATDFGTSILALGTAGLMPELLEQNQLVGTFARLYHADIPDAVRVRQADAYPGLQP